MVQCISCRGAYEPIQPDGTRYFHVCPPLSVVELDAAVKGGKVKLPAGETPDDAIIRRVYERLNKRDENVPSTAEPDKNKIKAAGLGTTKLADAPPAVVVVG